MSNTILRCVKRINKFLTYDSMKAIVRQKNELNLLRGLPKGVTCCSLLNLNSFKIVQTLVKHRDVDICLILNRGYTISYKTVEYLLYTILI